MLTTEVLINFVSALTTAALGLLILVKGPRDDSRRIFALTTVSVVLWIFAATSADLAAGNFTLAYTMACVAIYGPLISLPLMYVFIRKFPKSRRPITAVESIALFLPAFLVLPFLLSPYNIKSITFRDWGTDWVPGEIYYFFGLFLLVILPLMGVELFKKMKMKLTEEEHAQTLFLFLAFGSMLFFGIMANLVMPILGYTRASAIGPSSALLFVIFTSYAIAKHHLLDVKVVAAEIFGSTLALLTFFQIFSSASVTGFLLSIGLFLMTAIFLVLLIKSVLGEVKQRENLQILTKELRARNAQLKKLDDLKSTMVSIASHQLRGPLGGMRGYLTMFRDGDLGPITDKQKDIVKMNLSTLSRLLNAVETFLDITKIEAGKMVLRKEILPLDDAVHDVAHEFEIMLKSKGLELKTDIEEHIWVDFDPEKIKHVIFNLIDNAMKYTEEGSITVTLHKEGGEAVIRVTDTGKGIPKDDAPRLFQKFERGILVVDRGGSGLGLYIVKMLTEMLGGHVDVTSPGEGKGSTFYVRLPLAQGHH